MELGFRGNRLLVVFRSFFSTLSFSLVCVRVVVFALLTGGLDSTGFTGFSLVFLGFLGSSKNLLG